MSKYNPKIHNRKSIRLKGYDYSQAGLYFVTICVQNRQCLFGNIKDGILYLNDAGKMIEKWYFELENKFPDIKCREKIIMPNHFHCIIQNVGVGVGTNVGSDVGSDVGAVGSDVGADLRVCPNTTTNERSITDERIMGEHVGSPQRGSPQRGSPQRDSPQRDSPQRSPERPPQGSPLHSVVQWFKTMTTNEYIRNVKSNDWKRFNGKLWQRNYWEHIIRNQKAYQNISEYIINNPSKWNTDTLNTSNL